MNGRTSPPPTNQEQVHIDIGALAQRVTGVEGTLQQIWGALGDLSKKLDAKPTSIWIILGSLGAAFAVVGGAITFLLSPINTDLSRHELAISRIAASAVNREDYLRDRDTADARVARIGDRQKQNEDAYNTVFRQFADEIARDDERIKANLSAYLVAHERLENRVRDIEANLVKRPEIESANKAESEARAASERTGTARDDALSNRLNGVESEIHALFPPGKQIEEMWAILRDIQSRQSAQHPAGQ